jgi:hypothetical protein
MMRRVTKVKRDADNMIVCVYKKTTTGDVASG